MASKFAKKRCVPCEGGISPLGLKLIRLNLKHLPEWSLGSGRKSIFTDYVMKDFMSAVRLIRQIAKIAEEENHHPDIHLTGYRKLRIELTTHAAGGVTENDFILAAKITELSKKLRKK